MAGTLFSVPSRKRALPPDLQKQVYHNPPFEAFIASMRNRTRICWKDTTSGFLLEVEGIVNGIRVEDGSGKCFLITLMGNPKEYFLRCP